MKKIISVGLVIALALTAVFSVSGNSVATSTLTGQEMACLQGGADCELEAILVDVSCYLMTGAAELCALIAAIYYIGCILF
ncbi:MAG: hypothetical protein ACRDGA_08200 [Bacteroidota bacterium]